MVDGRRRLPSSRTSSSSSLSLSSLYRINVFILLVRFLTTQLHLIIILQEVREGAGAIPAFFFPVWGVCVCMMRHLLTSSSSSKPPLPPRVNVDSIYSRSGYGYSLDSISCMIFFFFFLFLFLSFLPPATAPTNARRVSITVATGIVSSCPHQLCEPSRRGAHGSMLW